MLIFPLTVFFVILFGLSVGSFLNVCIHRLPRKESILHPRSRCPHCKKILMLHDLLPVLSYLLTLGRCRYCGELVSYRYPVVEILTSIVFVLLYLRFSLSLDFMLYMILFSLLIVATFSDIETEIIPDSVSILGGIPALLIFASKGIPAYPLLGMLCGSGIMWLLFKSASIIYKKEAMGEGDVKLAMMIGAYLGWQGTVVSIFISFISGAFIGLFLIGINKKKFGQHIPFGPFLALGAAVAVFFGKLLWDWYLGMLF